MVKCDNMYMKAISMLVFSTFAWCDINTPCGTDVSACGGQPTAYVCNNNVCKCSDTGRAATLSNVCLPKGAPGPVQKLTITSPKSKVSETSIYFLCPENHEHVTNYTITHEKLPSSEKEVKTVEPEFSNNRCFYMGTLYLKADNNYTISVVANTKDGEGEIVERFYHVPIGRPSLFGNVLTDVGEATEKSFTIKVCLNCLLNDVDGPVIFTALLACKWDKCIDKSLISINAEELKKYTTYFQSKKDDFNSSYLITKPNWLNNSSSKDMFVVGDEDCSGRSKDKICNGPLTPGTSYGTIAMSCSEAGCSLKISTMIQTKDTSNNNIGLYVGIGVGTVVVIVGGSIIYVFVSKRCKK